jgi:hypothetical protein
VIVEHCAQITSPMSTVPIFSSAVRWHACRGRHGLPEPRRATTSTLLRPGFLRMRRGRSTHPLVRRFFHALEPHSRGVYVNFVSDDAGDRIRVAYSDQQWVRLIALKAKYDHTNFFRMNANIPPR